MEQFFHSKAWRVIGISAILLVYAGSAGAGLLMPPASSGVLGADGAWLLLTRFRRAAPETA